MEHLSNDGTTDSARNTFLHINAQMQYVSAYNLLRTLNGTFESILSKKWVIFYFILHLIKDLTNEINFE